MRQDPGRYRSLYCVESAHKLKYLSKIPVNVQHLNIVSLEEKLKEIPSSPGVYLHKDSAGKVIYVGKAKNLRSRVRSYFRARPFDRWPPYSRGHAPEGIPRFPVRVWERSGGKDSRFTAPPTDATQLGRDRRIPHAATARGRTALRGRGAS